MSIETIKAVCQRFLEDPKPQVLVIKGSWGAGKTYTLNKIIEENQANAGLRHYSYVSLFGITSTSQLAVSIFTSSKAIDLVGKKLSAKEINENWYSLSKQFVKSGFGFAKKLDFPYVKNLSIGLEQIAASQLKETIISLDDFERTSINAKELLGFITSLKEERKCKVILIFNQDQLGDKAETYDLYRDKVVDIELLFAPSLSEAIDIAFPIAMPQRDAAKQCALALEITNIRVLKKIEEFINLITPHIQGLHPKLFEQAIWTLVLVTWAYYENDGSKPDVKFIREWNSVGWGVSDEDEADENDKVTEWAALIRAYGLSHFDEFDMALSKVIEHGYVEDTGLIQEATKLDAQFRAQDLENSFSESWNLFHNYLSDNTDELIKRLQESFKKSYQQVTPINLNGTVRLMRELGRDDIADEMIDFYISHRTEDNRLFDLEEYPFAADIDDLTLRSKFKEAHISNLQLPTLRDAVLAILRDRSWSQAQIEVVKNASIEDFYQLFMNNQGNQLPRIIRACLQFEAIGGYQELAEKPRQALKRIGLESKLNSMRVKRYGILPDHEADKK